jgi:hypothetical protein
MSTATARRKKKAFIPKTPFGRRLLQLREQAIAEGMTLMTADEILNEVKKRRGESI